MEDKQRINKIKELIKAEGESNFSFKRMENLLVSHPVVFGVVYNPATILDVLDLPKLQKTLGIEISDAQLLQEVKDLLLTIDSVMVLRNKPDHTSIQVYNRFSGNLIFSTHNNIKEGYSYYDESRERIIGDITKNTALIATGEKKTMPVFQRRTRKLLVKEVSLDKDWNGPRLTLKQPVFLKEYFSVVSAQEEYLHFYDILARKASRIEMDDELGDAYYFNDILAIQDGKYFLLLLEKPYSNEMKLVSFSLERDSDREFQVEKVCESETFKIMNKKEEMRALFCHEEYLDNVSMFYHKEHIFVYKTNTFWVFSIDEDADNIELVKEHEVKSSKDDQLIFQKGNFLVLLRPSETDLMSKCLSLE